MPGDTLIDGKTLQNRLTRGGQDRIGLYTSPSIKYSELDIYTKPTEWKGHQVRVVIQCRQKPESYRAGGETIGWQRRFGTTAISQHFPQPRDRAVYSCTRQHHPVQSASVDRCDHKGVARRAAKTGGRTATTASEPAGVLEATRWRGSGAC
eukprot:403055-Rhodomonas_salina.1